MRISLALFREEKGLVFIEPECESGKSRILSARPGIESLKSSPHLTAAVQDGSEKS
jgi:hypothetical protein